MEVTRHNFHTILPEIESAIKNAHFLCIDGEFTGLFSGSEVTSFDTPSECYQFYRKSSKEFLLIQFGLSAFRFDAETKTYKHSTYSFYLFPRREVRGASDKVFSCQSSCIEFLTKHKLDFNKVFYDGITYIDTEEEVKLREFIEEKQKSEKAFKKPNRESFGNVMVPANFQPQIDQMCNKVEEFIKDTKKKSIEFENLNAFQRKLAYQELELKFKTDIFLETQNIGDKRVLVVNKSMSEEEKLARLEIAHEKDWAEIDAAVGFSTVARLISDSRKLIVGHNVILDIMHTLNNFFYPIPDEYDAFKALIPHIFPNIIDTMYMVKTNPFRDVLMTVDLKSLFASVKVDPFSMPKIGSEKEDNMEDLTLENEKFHSAGYDALVTGACFLSMFEYLKKTEALGDDCHLDAESGLLKPFINRLFLYKTHFQGSPCINLSGKDPNPHREHVFHLRFPKEWKKNNISDIFEQYGDYFNNGAPGGLSTVAFIDSTSAYVSLKQHSKAESVKRELCTNNESYKLTPFWQYKLNLNKTISLQQESDGGDKIVNEDLLPSKKIEDSIMKRNHENFKLTSEASESAINISHEAIKRSAKMAKYGKKRKLSHTTSGDFLISGNTRKEDDEKANDISDVFEESQVWD